MKSRKLTTIELVEKFVNQRSGIEWANYGRDREGLKYFRAAAREITADRTDFYTLLSFASRRIDNLEEKLNEYLKASGDRLTMPEEGKLQYITGQDFSTEYRAAACRTIASLIWKDFANETHENGEEVYTDGNDIRKALKRAIRGRRVHNNYFN